MNKSEKIGNLAKALAAVQSQLNPAAKDAKNPFFKSTYATLNSIWDSCRDLLADNSLAIAQLNQIHEHGVVIETVLMHESGEWISGEMFLPLSKNDAQGMGSAMSYGRRYGLAAIIGIVADEDDDANAASHPRQQQPTKQPQPLKQVPPPKQLPIEQRIRNAQFAIEELGGKVEPFSFEGKTEEDKQAELDTLNEQYKRLKQTKAK